MKICGEQHELIYSDPNGWSDNLGRANLREAKILINKNMNRETQEKTVIHEVIHQIASDNSLDLSEIQVSVLSLWIYVWIMDNKDFVLKIITKEEKC